MLRALSGPFRAFLGLFFVNFCPRASGFELRAREGPAGPCGALKSLHSVLQYIFEQKGKMYNGSSVRGAREFLHSVLQYILEQKGEMHNEPGLWALGPDLGVACPGGSFSGLSGLFFAISGAVL